MIVGLQLPVQSVSITTNVVSLNPADGEVYSIQHYVIKFVSNLRQIGCFLQVLDLYEIFNIKSQNKHSFFL
jgi:hypothetical protein